MEKIYFEHFDFRKKYFFLSKNFKIIFLQEKIIFFETDFFPDSIYVSTSRIYAQSGLGANSTSGATWHSWRGHIAKNRENQDQNRPRGESLLSRYDKILFFLCS